MKQIWLYLLATCTAGFILLSTPVRISAADFSQYSPSTSYLPWANWYPVDFGQPVGYRLVNRWDSVSSPNAWMHGHSALHIGNNLPTLPTAYNGNRVDYFFLWQCRNRIGEAGDANCYDQTLYREIISQGTAVDIAGKTTLEEWSRGSPGSYETYYDPAKIGFANCDGNNIKSFVSDLNSPDLKKPWVLRLPDKQGYYYVSDPVCALVFNGYVQDKTKVIDSRYQGGSPVFETGNWITLTLNEETYTDNFGFSVIHAENIYLTDNTAASDRFNQQYCGANPSDTLHCPGGAGLTYTVNGKVYRTFVFEQYWMRKTAKSGIYGNITDRYGFGAFLFNSTTGTAEWDKVKNDGISDTAATQNNQVWSLEKCSTDSNFAVVSCTPLSSMGITPTVTPTPPCDPTSWSGWGSCNKNCGGGTQSRTNACGTVQTQSCNTQACITNTPIPPNTPVPIQGDLNNDNHVNIFDYNILVTNFGKTGTAGFTPSDINRDGKVDIFDYNILVGNFGK